MSKHQKNKRNLSERYGEEEGRFYRSGENYLNKPTPKTFDQRIAKAANSDWDTREQQRAFDLALRDQEFRDTLDKKTQEFVDNYKNGKNHHKGMAGITSLKDAQTIDEFGRLWHKHESGNGGKYTSVSDYAGATSHMDDRMRKFHDRNFVTQDDLDHSEMNKKKPENITIQDRDVPVSPELEAAREKIKEQPRDIYDFNNSNERPPETDNADNAANAFLNDYRERINSARPKSDELQAAVNRLNNSISV